MREISTHVLSTNPPYAWQVEKAPLESYADVGGLEQQVQEIKEAVELPLTHPELYEDIGIKPPKARAAPNMHACCMATLGCHSARTCSCMSIHVSSAYTSQVSHSSCSQAIRSERYPTDE